MNSSRAIAPVCLCVLFIFQLLTSSSAFSLGRFGWPGLEWREIIDWWTSGYSRGVVIGRNYIPPCKLCDMPRMFRVD